MAIVDALIGFVQRNPLTVLVILILALGAPALLKGIAVFILYFVLGIVLLGAVLLFSLRWRIGRMQRDMEEQMRGGFGGGEPFGEPFGGRPRTEKEGEVKVHTTADMPGKRVSKTVGDYVEFEETPADDTKEE